MTPRDPLQSHQAIIDRFSDYYDGELPPPDRAEFERYLEQHPRCREEYEGFARSLEMTHQLQMMFAPEDLAQKVTRRIHRQSRGRFFGESLTGHRPTYALFVIVLLAVVGALYLFGNSQRDAALTVIEPGLLAPYLEVHVPLDAGHDMYSLTVHFRSRGWRVESAADRVIEVYVPVNELGRFDRALHISTGVALPERKYHQHDVVIVRIGSPRR